MNASAILAIAKKHWIPLALLGVALVAIAFALVVVPGWFGQLETDLTARKTTYDEATALKTTGTALTVPVMSPSQTAPAPLGGYPTPELRERVTKALQTLAAQAKDVVDEAVKRNARTPVYANGLPIHRPPNPPVETRSAFDLSQFQIEYLKRLNAYPTNSPEDAKAQYQASIFGVFLKAAMTPSDQEMQALIREQERQISRDLKKDPITGLPVNEAEIAQRKQDLYRTFPIKERQQRAASSLLYVNLGPALAFEVDPKMADVKKQPETTLDTFNAQLSLWQQEAVAEAIASVNRDGKATRVADAPIKHVVAVRLRLAPIVSTAAPGGFGGVPAPVDPAAAAPPADLNPDPSQPIARNPLRNAGGHTHNSFYDPYPLTLTIRVDARRIPQVLAGLARARGMQPNSNVILQVNNVNYSTVDVGLAAQMGYLYGNDPVVELTIDADLIFLRQWLIPYMPSEARKAYALWQTGVAPGTVAPGGGMTPGFGTPAGLP